MYNNKYSAACTDTCSSIKKQQFTHKWRSVWINHRVSHKFRFNCCYTTAMF